MCLKTNFIPWFSFGSGLFLKSSFFNAQQLFLDELREWL